MSHDFTISSSEAPEIKDALAGDQIVKDLTTGRLMVGLRGEDVIEFIVEAAGMPRLSALTMMLIVAYHRLRTEGMSPTQIRKQLLEPTEKDVVDPSPGLN